MRQRRWGSLRTALALVLAVSSLGVFAAFGGMSFGPDSASAQYEYGGLVTICHRTGSAKKPFVTIAVHASALDVYLARGYTIGPCPG